MDDDESKVGNSNNEAHVEITSFNEALVRPIAPKTKKKRAFKKKNPAMGDTAFLRKRTANLLSITKQNSDNKEGALGGGMKVDRKTFHFLMDAWAFSGEIDAVEQASGLLSRMEELASWGNFNIEPDVRSYTKMINAISRSTAPSAGDEADAIFAKMEELYQTGSNRAARPNTYTYTAVIEAHAHSGARGSAKRAAEWCERMIDAYEPSPHNENKESSVRPTARAFNAAISAYAKSGEEGAAARAERLFDRMEELYETGVEEAKPNAFNFNSLITAWANCCEEGSAQRAEEILERMEYLYKQGDEKCKPTTISFNAVIDAYAKSGDEYAAQKAEEVLRHMEDLYGSGQNLDARPNVRSFNSVINAWAKSRNEEAAWKAQDMLDLMEKLYAKGNKEVRPDVHSFCTVINAWARSQQHGKAERALNLFREMKQLHEAGNKHLRPNTVAANAVMNACAYTSGDVHEQNRAVEIAHTILKELEQSPYGKPDQVTYGTFLKVCANQMPDCSTRNQVISVVFKKCQKTGQVGNFILQQLKAMASEEIYMMLLGRGIHEDIQIADLPSEWWCNVVENRWRRRGN